MSGCSECSSACPKSLFPSAALVNASLNSIIQATLYCDCRLREMVLRWLPVSSNAALEGQAPGAGESPIKTVLRSKGFMWMSHSHTTAFYWSHAGQHFEIRDEGDW